MKIVSQEKFCDTTALLPYLIVETIINRKQCYHLTPQQVKWFICHCDFRVRYKYSTDPDMKKVLNSGNRGRDWCYQFFAHWLDGYLLNVPQYQERHPMSAIGATDQDVEAVQLSGHLTECLEWNRVHSGNAAKMAKPA